MTEQDAAEQRLTVPVQRRPGYRTFYAATLKVGWSPYAQGALSIDALLCRGTPSRWECLTTIIIHEVALRAFLLSNRKDRKRGTPPKIEPDISNALIVDRNDHQVLTASGIFLRQPERNENNNLYLIDCLMDSALIVEEQFALKNGFWVPAGEGKVVKVREVIGTLIVQEPALTRFYQDIKALIKPQQPEARMEP